MLHTKVVNNGTCTSFSPFGNQMFGGVGMARNGHLSDSIFSEYNVTGELYGKVSGT